MYGPGVHDVLTSDCITKDIAIAGEVTVYTKSFSLKLGEYFGIFYEAASTNGSPNLKIELEQGYQKPSTEGSSDAEWCESADVADIETALTDEVMHLKVLEPTPAPFGRFKITGNSGNNADTTIRMRLTKQENLA